MKGLPASVLVAAALAAAPAFAQNAAPGVNGYFTLSNGYWAHGLAHNDGLTLQAGVDYQTQGSWFAGAWAANVDYAVEFSYDEPRDYAASLYGGYHRRAADWSWTLSLAQYLYPGTAVSYDYDELSGTVGFRDRVFYSASYANDYYGGTRASWNHELSFALPLRGDFELGATLGRFDFSGSGPDYSHWNAGVSKVLRSVVLDLRYYDTGYDRVGWLGDPDAQHYVLSVSYALRPKKSGF